jgi:hypothetical protein
MFLLVSSYKGKALEREIRALGMAPGIQQLLVRGNTNKNQKIATLKGLGIGTSTVRVEEYSTCYVRSTQCQDSRDVVLSHGCVVGTCKW